MGGLGSLWLFDMELSIYAMIGLFMLMGIVKKNGIMMIDFAIMREQSGMSPRTPSTKLAWRGSGRS